MIGQNGFNPLSFALKTLLFVLVTVAMQQAQMARQQSPLNASGGSGTPHKSPVKIAGSAGSKPSGLATYSGTGAVYYVDFSTGADTNSGTSKSTPWKHSPGMQGCTGSCASTSLSPGDSVIFKGGVTGTTLVLL